ncbi:MAG TPA: hypothetical protein VK619_05155 [Pyrinomonadaceae bacterium]|nr:hypothetical protein [Pyrinomonadaceae bacterium]
MSKREQERVLVKNGPLFPENFDPRNYSIRAFVKGNWQVIVEYGLEVDSTATITIQTNDATFSQTLDTRTGVGNTQNVVNFTGEDGTHVTKVLVKGRAVFLLPASEFGQSTGVAKIFFHAQKNSQPRNPRRNSDQPQKSALLQIYALSMGIDSNSTAELLQSDMSYLPVQFYPAFYGMQYEYRGSTVIDRILFDPFSIKASLGQKFTYQFHSRTDLSRLSAIFFQDYVDREGALISRQVYSQRLGAIRRDEWSPTLDWDGRTKNGKASMGTHELQLRGWRGTVADGVWIACSPDRVLTVDN